MSSAHRNRNKVGLDNLGNTCFLNSVLQALRHTPSIREMFISPSSEMAARELRQREGTKKFKIFISFGKLMQEIERAPDGSSISPSALVHSLHDTVKICDDDWLRPRQQADAAECLQYLLEAFHDTVYRRIKINILGRAANSEEESHIKAMESWSSFMTKEYSPIVQHMYGQTQMRVQCQQCRTVNERYEPWLTLKVAIPGGSIPGSEVPDLVECLDASLNTQETIEGYQCDMCQSRQTAIITTRLSKLPSTLILSLKRFTNTGAKIRGKVVWDVNRLDMGKWFAFKRCPYTGLKAGKLVYQTISVIEHNGSSSGGHYRMFARDDGGDVWSEYDDSAIRENVAASEVVSPDSYVLFLTCSNNSNRLPEYT
jgi:ubiquitin C-terminal hydrolase